MKERPILFSAPMVRALLAGTKTQTRRPAKVPANATDVSYWAPPGGASREGWADPGLNYWTPDATGGTLSNHLDRCPYGQPGDRLWVRESWKYAGWTEDGYPFIGYGADNSRHLIERGIPEEWSDRLTETWAALSAPDNYSIDNEAADRRWRSSIHMPRWACRMLLEVTDVRVERLQEICLADARAEGITFKGQGWQVEDGTHFHCYDPRQSYWSLWQSINGPGSVDANPWVWRVEFKRVISPSSPSPIPPLT